MGMSSKRALNLSGVLLIGSGALAACVASPNVTAQLSVATVRDLKEAPEKWNGKRVRVAGWLTRDFENSNLYATRAAACRFRDDPPVIGADTDKVLDRGTMRKGIFEATFNNFYGVTQPNGDIVTSTGHAIPGPLEKIEIVRWLSRAVPACRGH